MATTGTTKAQINTDALFNKISTYIKTEIEALEQRLTTKLESLINSSTPTLATTTNEPHIRPSDDFKPVANTKTFNHTTLILGDSTTKDLSSRGLSKLAGERVRVESKGGATPSTVNTVANKNIKNVVLHAGTNSLQHTNLENESDASASIANEINSKLDELSEELGDAIAIAYSSITHRFDKGDKSGNPNTINSIIDKTNTLVAQHCQTNQYNYITNENILKSDLYDGLHLNEEGATKLAKNIASVIRPKHNSSSRHCEENTNFMSIPVKKNGTRPVLKRQEWSQQMRNYGSPHPRLAPPHHRNVHQMYPQSYAMAAQQPPNRMSTFSPFYY